MVPLFCRRLSRPSHVLDTTSSIGSRREGRAGGSRSATAGMTGSGRSGVGLRKAGALGASRAIARRCRAGSRPDGHPPTSSRREPGSSGSPPRRSSPRPWPLGSASGSAGGRGSPRGTGPDVRADPAPGRPRPDLDRGGLVFVLLSKTGPRSTRGTSRSTPGASSPGIDRVGPVRSGRSTGSKSTPRRTSATRPTPAGSIPRSGPGWWATGVDPRVSKPRPTSGRHDLAGGRPGAMPILARAFPTPGQAEGPPRARPSPPTPDGRSGRHPVETTARPAEAAARRRRSDARNPVADRRPSPVAVSRSARWSTLTARRPTGRGPADPGGRRRPRGSPTASRPCPSPTGARLPPAGRMTRSRWRRTRSRSGLGERPDRRPALDGPPSAPRRAPSGRPPLGPDRAGGPGYRHGRPDQARSGSRRDLPPGPRPIEFESLPVREQPDGTQIVHHRQRRQHPDPDLRAGDRRPRGRQRRDLARRKGKDDRARPGRLQRARSSTNPPSRWSSTSKGHVVFRQDQLKLYQGQERPADVPGRAGLLRRPEGAVPGAQRRARPVRPQPDHADEAQVAADLPVSPPGGRPRRRDPGQHPDLDPDREDRHHRQPVRQPRLSVHQRSRST